MPQSVIYFPIWSISGRSSVVYSSSLPWLLQNTNVKISLMWCICTKGIMIIYIWPHFIMLADALCVLCLVFAGLGTTESLETWARIPPLPPNFCNMPAEGSYQDILGPLLWITYYTKSVRLPPVTLHRALQHLLYIRLMVEYFSELQLRTYL